MRYIPRRAYNKAYSRRLLGIFDSGVGGLMSFRDVRKALPSEDIVYLADRKNAPYGTKEKDVLIKLVSNDIQRLREYGSDRILIACCTASAVYPYLSEDLKKISLPIITPTAMAASEGKRVAVIATRHTVKESAFAAALGSISPLSSVFEIEAGELVGLVEEGGRDGFLTEKQTETVKKTAKKIKATDPDTLILGCTHFSHLEKTFKKLLSNVRIISAAREGAAELVKSVKPGVERGVSRYTE